MFFTIEAGIIAHIESFHAVPYWKGQFSNQVLVEINKGWCLVGEGSCIGCYKGDCRMEPFHRRYEWMDRSMYDTIRQGVESYYMSSEDNWTEPLSKKEMDTVHHLVNKIKNLTQHLDANAEMHEYYQHLEDLLSHMDEDSEEEEEGEWDGDMWTGPDGSTWRHDNGLWHASDGTIWHYVGEEFVQQ